MHLVLYVVTYNILTYCTITTCTNSLWSDIIAKGISAINKRSQNVYIFTCKYNNIITLEHNFLLQRIGTDVPFMIIDLAEKIDVSSNKPKYVRKFGITKNDALYLILHHKSDSYNDIEMISDYLDYFNEHDSISPRPKCLTIFFNNDSTLEKQFKILLKDAWIRKFLDFTIIEVMLNNNNLVYGEQYVYFYNPFDKIFVKQILGENEYIFPDKLVNLAGFSLNVVYPNFTKYNTIPQYELYPKVLIASKVLNFTINAITVSNFTIDQFPAFVKHVTRLFKTGVPDFSTFHVMKGTANSINYLEVDIPMSGCKLVVVGPMIYTKKLKIPLHILLDVFVFPLLIVILVKFALKLHMNIEKWSVSDILILLVGIPTKKTRSQVLGGKIITSFIILLSINYSAEFYSNFLKIQLIQTEMSFDTMEKIRDTQFSIYINQASYNISFANNEMLKDIKSQVIIIKDIEECVNLLLQYKNRLCALIEYRAVQLVDQYRNADGLPLMKMANPGFCEYARRSHIFQKASPYAQKLNRIFKSLYESSIAEVLINQGNTNYTVLDEKLYDEPDHTLAFDLLLILSIGYAFSLVMFGLEYMSETIPIIRRCF